MNNTVTPHFKDQLELVKVMDHKTARVYCYTNFVVVEVNEGVTMSYKSAFSLLVSGLKHLGTKPWIYVSHRINSYAVVPTDYKYLNRVPTLKGLVIISPDKSLEKNATLEEPFFTKPFIIANDFEEAYEWGTEVLKNS